jgi:hypothetical protein
MAREGVSSKSTIPASKQAIDFARYDGVDPHSEVMSSKEELGSLLVLSGGGYRYDRPWLYYLTNLYLEIGHSATCVAYQQDFVQDPHKRPILRLAVSRLIVEWAQQRLNLIQSIAAFSFGNRILSEALQTGLKLSTGHQIISMSPLLHEDDEFQRVRKFPLSTIFIFGEADSCAPRDRVETLQQEGFRIWTVPNGDHGLDDPHSVRRSIDSIRGFMDWLRPCLTQPR